MFDTLVNPILNPLLALPPLGSIGIVALLVSLIVVFIYKLMTDQTLMKTLKADIKKFQDEMKLLKNNPAKLMEMQKKAMETNMKYMMQSMKPTLITFLPIILIFGWLNANLAYEPINPGETFITEMTFETDAIGEVILKETEGIQVLSENPAEIQEKKATWKLKASEGDYLLEYEYKDQLYEKEVLVTNTNKYRQPQKKVNDKTVSMITISNNKMMPLGNLSLLGWKPGWLGTYIIFSIVFSMTLRKVLNVH